MAYNAKTNWRNNDIVTPDDLNRIERGIADSASPAEDVSVYVAPSGNDTTGTGEVDKPFRTIQKAIDSLPDVNKMSKLCIIKLAEGQYPGFTLSCSKRIEISAQGEIQILGDVVLNSGRITFVEEPDAELYVLGGKIVMNGGYFVSRIMLGITNQEGMVTGVAIECNEGSYFAAYGDMVIANHTTGITCAHSHMYLHRLLTDIITTGIICDCGIVQIGDDVIQASAKFVTQHGGRIYVGAQTDTPNY